MKYISLLNPITIKYLIDNPNTKYFIINTLKLILNDEDFELLNYFTHEEENVRSYTFFKNKSKIVLMDYNINENKDQFNDDLDILNFIKETSKEEVHLVYFTTEKGSNIYDENIHIIRKSIPTKINIIPKIRFDLLLCFSIPVNISCGWFGLILISHSCPICTLGTLVSSWDCTW